MFIEHREQASEGITDTHGSRCSNISSGWAILMVLITVLSWHFRVHLHMFI